MSIEEKKTENSRTDNLQFGSGFAVQSYFEREVEEARRKKAASAVTAVIIMIAAAVIIAGIVMFSTGFHVYSISSDAMAPVLEYGDVVVVRETHDTDTGDICCFASFDKTIMRRVAAKAGSTVDIDGNGEVTVDGIAVPAEYGSVSEDALFPMCVPEGSVLIFEGSSPVGNDEGSTLIKESSIIGKTVFRIWPLGRLGSI